MLDWLTGTPPPESAIPPELLARQLAVAAALGLTVGLTYLLALRKRRADAAPFVSTLVLLTMLIALVTVVIGNSVARAFGLVGALSIVRFRTVVDDTRDTAFVIFAVVIGMAVGARLADLALVALPIVGLATVLLGAWGRAARGSAPTGTLVVRLAIGVDPDAALAVALAKHLDDVRLLSAGTARQGAALDLTYAARPRAKLTAVALIAELNRVEGVQGVEWKESAREG